MGQKSVSPRCNTGWVRKPCGCSACQARSGPFYERLEKDDEAENREGQAIECPARAILRIEDAHLRRGWAAQGNIRRIWSR